MTETPAIDLVEAEKLTEVFLVPNRADLRRAGVRHCGPRGRKGTYRRRATGAPSSEIGATR